MFQLNRRITRNERASAAVMAAAGSKGRRELLPAAGLLDENGCRLPEISFLRAMTVQTRSRRTPKPLMPMTERAVSGKA